MDVELYVYDLSKGLARQMSRQFFGIHIDAVYHTAIVFGGVEYFFGQGVHTCYPGSTHHGRPMEVIKLGQTSLPLEVILEYLESLKAIYTTEVCSISQIHYPLALVITGTNIDQSYDLFLHNCNNFSNDFAMFLVGQGIPGHITSLPQTVLNTPFGRMLKPQLDSAMRSMTQAPVPPQSIAKPRTTTTSTTTNNTAAVPMRASGKVHNVTSVQALTDLLKSAGSSCAIIFFTSATCAPCRLAYPAYDDLAREAASKATLIKVDITQAPDIAGQYAIRVTPTFITFLKGSQQESWSGADPAQLLAKVRALVDAAFPPHPHQRLRLPTLLAASSQPVLFTKIPPLDKVTSKLGVLARDPGLEGVVRFIRARQVDGAKEAPLPDLPAFRTFLRKSLSELPVEARFASYDVFRMLAVDARGAGFFASESHCETILALVEHVNALTLASCPYNLRLVALQACCNCFSTPIFQNQSLQDDRLSDALLTLVSTSLAERQHATVRVTAASAALNMATCVSRARTATAAAAAQPTQSGGGVSEGIQVGLAAALLEALAAEQESTEAIRGLVLAVARLAYCAPEGGEVLDLCRAMDAASVLSAAGKFAAREDVGLVRAVAAELMGKGLEST